MRRLAVFALCVTLTTIAALSAVARAGTGEPTCRPAEVRQHNEAVFGHLANRADALKLKAHARARGFQGIKIEGDGCTAGFQIAVRSGAK